MFGSFRHQNYSPSFRKRSCFHLKRHHHTLVWHSGRWWREWNLYLRHIGAEWRMRSAEERCAFSFLRGGEASWGRWWRKKRRKNKSRGGETRRGGRKGKKGTRARMTRIKFLSTLGLKIKCNSGVRRESPASDHPAITPPPTLLSQTPDSRGSYSVGLKGSGQPYSTRWLSKQASGNIKKSTLWINSSVPLEVDRERPRSCRTWTNPHRHDLPQNCA